MLALLRLNQRRITAQIPHNTTSYLSSTLKFCTQPPSSSQDDSLILRNKTTSYSCSISELCSQPQQPSQNDPIDINTITRIINDHPFPDQPLHPTLLRHLPPSTITTPLVENVLGRLFASHCNGLKALEFFSFTLRHSHTPPSPGSLEKTLHILTRMRYFEKAWGLLKEIGRTHPSLLTLKSMSIMLSKVAKYQSFEDTLEAFRRMEHDVFVGRVFGTDEFNVLLKAFCTQRQMKEARSVFAKMVPRFCANTKTMNILLLGFKESGDVTSVELFYHEMVKRGFSPDGVTYNIRIDAYCKKGCFGDALRILEEMEQRGFVPTIETITTLIHGAGLVRNRGKALQLFKEIHLRNLVADTGAYNALISSLIRMKDIESALLVMDEMVEKHVKLDGLTYHTLFLGLKRSKGVDGVSELYHKMTQRNFVPETRTVVMLMKYFCQNSRVDLGLSLWRYTVEKGYCPHSHALDLLVSGLCSRGLVEEAFECSKQLLERGRHMSTAAFLMMERFLLKAGDMAKLKELDCMIKKLQSVLPPSRGHATVLTNLRKHPNWNLFFSTLQGQRLAGGNSAVVTSSSSHIPSQQIPSASTRGVVSGYRSTIEYNACQMKDGFMPSPSPYDLSSSSRSQTTMIGDGELQRDNQPLIGGSMDTVNEKQIADMPRLPERDLAGTPYVPVYVMLPLGVINIKCELVDPDGLLKQLKVLKSVNVDGVMVDCWWGIVEAHSPQEYNWNGYKRLFQMVRELKLRLQVVMSFHECGGNFGDDVCIPLPHWVAEIGRSNPNIFFTDREGRHNPECLSWGIDKERVLRGRTALEVYFDFMRSFRVEFDEYFEDGFITMIEVGLGPCGELRYPSCTVKHGWRYPGIGEFQCYDQYMLKSLKKAAEARGHSIWARGPDNAGTYNSQPHETGFFCDGGDYDGFYGRFFLSWYSQVLVDHGYRVLSLAKLAFEGSCIAAKLSSIYWWYKTSSHAAELTAGYYNPCNRDGYATIMAMLQRNGVSLNISCADLHTLSQHEVFPETFADPEGLVWQVLNAGWDLGLTVGGENALPCLDRVSYNKVLDSAKPVNDPDGRHFSSFTYLRLSPLLMERQNFLEFERFVKRMHGEAVLDLQV